MKTLTLLLFICTLFVGCQTPEHVIKGIELQGTLVENLHENHKKIAEEALNLYKHQTTEDFEFIYELVKEEDLEKALRVKMDKLKARDAEIEKLRKKLEENETNFEQYKKLEEALK